MLETMWTRTGTLPITVRTSDAQRREPGTVYFTTRPGGGAGPRTTVGWLIGVGPDGDIVLERRFDGTSQDVRCLPNGKILFSQSMQGIVYEVNPDGSIHAAWHSRDKWIDKQPPLRSVELPVNHTHHTVNVMPNGNFLLLDAEVRSFDNWPSDSADRAAPRQKASVVGDVVKEVTREGRLVRAYHIFDLIDPDRITHGSFDNYWHHLGFPATNDWSHANAVAYDPQDDSIVVSLRHQDCIVKFGRQDGRLRWILGNPSEWRDPWRQYLLQPDASVRWQFHQHDCSITGPGRILCFDNGNFRAGAFETPLDPTQNFSRAVEFEIDEKNRTVRQIWQYGEERAPALFGCYQGGARRLPKTGNTLITFGGLCFDKDGKPAATHVGMRGAARILEVTSEGEVVLDIEVDDRAAAEPRAFSAFRADHMPA